MTQDREELKRLAEAATQGEWTAWAPDQSSWVVRSKWQEGKTRITAFLAVCQSAGQSNEGNAKFIAAANPATVLSLLSDLDAMQEENGRLRTSLERAADDLRDIGNQSPKPSNSPDPEHENYLRRVLISLAQTGHTRARQALSKEPEA